MEGGPRAYEKLGDGDLGENFGVGGRKGDWMENEKGIRGDEE